MEAAATITPESFSPLHLFLHADFVVKGVLLGLIFASLWSWAVIIDKGVRFTALNRAANSFEDEVGSGRPLEEVAADAGETPRHALPRMLRAALREWREARSKGLLAAGHEDAQAVFLIQRIDRVLDSAVARESQRVEEGLGSLAIVATASPFIGLFGTVWGIMTAFQAIAIRRTPTCRWSRRRSPRPCSPRPWGWARRSPPTSPTTSSPPTPPSTPPAWRASPTTW